METGTRRAMPVTRLATRDAGAVIHTELAIVGAGPVGLAIADRCARSGIDVLLLESGLESESEAHEALNEVVSETPFAHLRSSYHGSQATFWTAQRQAYGVRCRGVGGSTQAWAGKLAPFDSIDYVERSWVPASGWPIGADEFAPYIDEARELLGLCPVDPKVHFAKAGLRSCFWQFARSRNDRLDVMRFGRDFLPYLPGKVNVLLDATVTRLGFDPQQRRIDHLDIASLSGVTATVKPRRVVLASGGIENARLLLVSDDVEAGGIGNAQDMVGRHLIDHAGATIGRVEGAGEIAILARKFGFYGVNNAGRSHMFMHGLALSPDLQREREILNGAIYIAPQRAPDDPFDALKRLMRGRSKQRLSDLTAVARGAGLVARGLGAKALSWRRIPDRLREGIIGSAIRFAPNMVVEEFASGGLPHKLTGLQVEAIIETAPDSENRIFLCDRRDALGMRIAGARWQIGALEQRTMMALAEHMEAALVAAGLPPMQRAEWTRAAHAGAPPAIDLAHTMGTTRMAANPRHGVVDSDCRVFGVSNLFVAGGSVFPTGGHANPTWMYLALALRLAEHLKRDVSR